MSDSPRVLIIGAKGMLGTDLVQTFSERFGTGLEAAGRVVGIDTESVDITEPTSVFSAFSRYKPTLVVNAAAYTDVDGAETNRALAYRVNTQGPINLLAACREFQVPLVHFSTDYVFDGTLNRPQTEEDELHPASYYAETKALADRALLLSSLVLVLRVQWLYGKAKNRFTTLKDKKIFTPFSDQYGCPTWTRDIAAMVVTLCDRNARGLFHFAYDDYATWAEVFEFVKKELRLSTELRPKKTEEAKLPAARPKFGVLGTAKLRNFLGRDTLGDWKTALRDFLKDAGTT